MVPKAGYFTPLLHVMDVRRSIRFYELLGFELIDLEGAPECPVWAHQAWLKSLEQKKKSVALPSRQPPILSSSFDFRVHASR